MRIGLLNFRASLAQAPAEETTAALADPLVARLQNGDLAALAGIYDRHHASIRAFARRFTGDSAAAEGLR